MKNNLVLLLLLLLLALSLGGTVYSQYSIFQMRTLHEQELANLNKDVASQKKDKNEIRDLWEKQATLNDKLIVSQDKLNARIAEYQTVYKQSIRFINTSPQILPTISEANIKAAESNLKKQQEDLEVITQENIAAKKGSTERVNNLYLQAGEDQKNRANPEGIR